MVLVESATDTDVLVTETEKSLGMSFWARIPSSPDVAAGGRRGLPIVRADPTNEINEPSQRSAGEYPANTDRQPASGSARPTRTEHAGELRRAVHETVIGELGSGLDELRDAYVAADRAVHTALEAVLAPAQPGMADSISAELSERVCDCWARRMTSW